MNMKHESTLRTPSEPFRTHDLFLSAFLLAKGAVLVDHVREGSRVAFIFSSESDPQRLARDFYNGAAVGVSSYVQALQNLKSLIYDNV